MAEEKIINQVSVVGRKKTTHIVSLNLKKLIEKLISESDTNDECEIVLTFGEKIDGSTVTFDDGTDNWYQNITFHQISRSEIVNMKNCNSEILYHCKKERKKIERKNYQERKNKESKKKVSVSGACKTNVKPMNPNSKKLITDIPTEKPTQDDGFVQITTKNNANKHKKTNDWSGIDVQKWSSNQFLQYMIHKFKHSYGFNSIEFISADGTKHQPRAKGMLFVKIKQHLIAVFADSGMNNGDLKKYLDWVYDVKAKDLKFPVSLNFLCSKVLITEWLQKMYVNSAKKSIESKTKVKIHKANG